jgi:hypothetical protein
MTDATLTESGVRAVLTGLSFALPVAVYFWLIEHYAVNVIFWDQTDDMRYIGDSYSGKLTFGDLWTQHEVHRMLFPNLLALLLAHTTHFNVVLEEYLSGLMLCAAIVLLILTDKRRSPSRPWIYYCPVAVVMLSLAQFQNTLWGFQMAWFLVLLALSVSLFLLDRQALTRPALAGAIIAAVVGSFSSLQGLLIWPVGLVLLYRRRRSAKVVLAWVTSAVATAGAYLHHLHSGAGYSTPSYVFTHPIECVKYFLFIIGGIIGVMPGGVQWQIIGGLHLSSGVGVLLGVIRLLIVAWIVVAYGPRRAEERGSPVGVALICFGLLFSLLTTVGRASGSATPSRFTTYNLLVLAGCYLVLLQRPPRREVVKCVDRVTTRTFPFVRIALMVVIGIQIVVGTAQGIEGARYWHQYQIAAADITANIDKASGPLVSQVVRPDGTTPQWALIARTYHLSLFATGALASYRKIGLFPELTALHTRVVVPSNDATLSRRQVLVAAASDMSGISKVEFLVTSQTLRGTVISTTFPTLYGWLGAWDTNGVANGAYTLQSVATGVGGRTATSPGITVKVSN